MNLPYHLGQLVGKHDVHIKKAHTHISKNLKGTFKNVLTIQHNVYKYESATFS